MSLETVVKVSLIILFLLFAYFMIGGYTPCTYSYHYSCIDIDNNTNINENILYENISYDNFQNNEFSKIPSSDFSNDMYPNKDIYPGKNKNIYQMGPYLNI